MNTVEIHVDRMVSLGGLCEVAAQLRRLTGGGAAYPMDWWVTPLGSLEPIIRDGFAHMFDPRYLRKVEFGGRPAIYSSFAETIHPHDMPADEIETGGINDISDKLAQRCRALAERMVRECNSGTTLFVRKVHSEFDFGAVDAASVSVGKLYEALGSISSSFYLLLLEYPIINGLPDRVYTGRVDEWLDSLPGLGSMRGWDRCFEKLPFRILARGNFNIRDLHD